MESLTGTAERAPSGSRLQITASGVSGHGRFSLRAVSTKGRIAHVHFVVSHVNDWTGYASTFDGSQLNGGGSTWTTVVDAYTDSGWVSGQLLGTATLVWSGTCLLLGPTDANYVP